MSAEYDAYIREHTSNVLKAADWLETNIPELNVNVYAFHNLLHHDEHASHIKLAPVTRETVEDILSKIRGRLMQY